MDPRVGKLIVGQDLAGILARMPCASVVYVTKVWCCGSMSHGLPVPLAPLILPAVPQASLNVIFLEFAVQGGCPDR